MTRLLVALALAVSLLLGGLALLSATPTSAATDSTGLLTAGGNCGAGCRYNLATISPFLTAGGNCGTRCSYNLATISPFLTAGTNCGSGCRYTTA